MLTSSEDVMWPQVIQTDGHPVKLIYVQSTDQVWVELTLDNHYHHHHHQQRQEQRQRKDDDDDDDVGEVVAIRQASEPLLHRAVHVDQHQQLGHDNRLLAVRRLVTRQHYYTREAGRNAYCKILSVSQSVFCLKTKPVTFRTARCPENK